MFSNPHKEQYDSLMAKLTPPQSGNAVMALNEEWINSAKELAKINGARSLLLGVMSCLTYLTVAVFTGSSIGVNHVALAGIVPLLLSVFHHMHTAETIRDPLRSGLRKLSRSNNCHKAIALVEKFDTCREYQAQVLAQGREFVEFDYQALRAIAESHPDYRGELNADVACKKLHGLAEVLA